jgi:hypothetical protein
MNALRPSSNSRPPGRTRIASALAVLGLAATGAAPAGTPATSATPASAPAAAPSPAPSAGAAKRAPVHAAVTEAEAREVMTALERAARRRNLDGLVDLLAPDATIEIRTRFDGREHVNRHDRASYLEMLTGGFAALNSLDGYDYAIADLALRVDGLAMVADSRVVETVIFDGRSQLTESRETARLERRGDRVLITRVIATTGAQEPPPAR